MTLIYNGTTVDEVLIRSSSTGELTKIYDISIAGKTIWEAWSYKTGELARCGGASASFWGGTWTGECDVIKPKRLYYYINGRMQDNPWGSHSVSIKVKNSDGSWVTVLSTNHGDGQSWAQSGYVDFDGSYLVTGIELIVGGKTVVYSDTKVYFDQWCQKGKQLESIIPTMTSDTLPYGRAFQKTQYSTALAYTNINGSTFYAGDLVNSYIGYERTKAFVCTKVEFKTYAQGTSGTNNPKNIIIQGADNYNSLYWSDIHSFICPNASQNNIIEFKNNKKFKAYRIFWQDCYGNTGYNACGISHIKMFGEELSPTPVRYIKDRIYGSTANTGNHWVEIQAIDANGNNVALGKTVTVTGSPTGGGTAVIVDGSVTTSSWGGTETRDGTVLIDLGAIHNLISIKIWHYYGDGRRYYGEKVSYSKDYIEWVYVLNNDDTVAGVSESSSGQTFDIRK